MTHPHQANKYWFSTLAHVFIQSKVFFSAGENVSKMFLPFSPSTQRIHLIMPPSNWMKSLHVFVAVVKNFTLDASRRYIGPAQQQKLRTKVFGQLSISLRNYLNMKSFTDRRSSGLSVNPINFLDSRYSKRLNDRCRLREECFELCLNTNTILFASSFYCLHWIFHLTFAPASSTIFSLIRAFTFSIWYIFGLFQFFN